MKTGYKRSILSYETLKPEGGRFLLLTPASIKPDTKSHREEAWAWTDSFSVGDANPEESWCKTRGIPKWKGPLRSPTFPLATFSCPQLFRTLSGRKTHPTRGSAVNPRNPADRSPLAPLPKPFPTPTPPRGGNPSAAGLPHFSYSSGHPSHRFCYWAYFWPHNLGQLNLPTIRRKQWRFLLYLPVPDLLHPDGWLWAVFSIKKYLYFITSIREVCRSWSLFSPTIRHTIFFFTEGNCQSY